MLRALLPVLVIAACCGDHKEAGGTPSTRTPAKGEIVKQSTDSSAPDAVLPADEFRVLLHSVTQDDIDLRRQAAADISISILKENGVWRTDNSNWKIPTEEGIRMEVKGVRTSDQEPHLAIANMCAHTMGMLRSAAWRTAPLEKAETLEKEVISVLTATDDPVAKTILLVGLASSPTESARDVVVASTADADLGVRKCANYLIQQCSANSLGPIGVIHIGSPPGDVDASGQKIRAMYEKDKTLSARITK